MGHCLNFDYEILLNTLQRSHIHEYIQRGIQMKDTEIDIYNQIFHAIINQHKHIDYYDSSLLTSKYGSQPHTFLEGAIVYI